LGKQKKETRARSAERIQKSTTRNSAHNTDGDKR